ncbi:aspartate aminotransferase family protein [Magnetospira sp. QH-2]|uniref:aspartate aminotransferase family protein n=1 Tax=Magnetospira sp. (strain QH-2) TaxID=1288970 RepID=UPI0005FA7170|nr:aspartate aminotransferase family protein [Magnetospira sp. QH-2]
MITAVMPTYARIDMAFERGEGCFLFDTEGKRYLDFAAGVAVNALGHAHPRMVAALTEQAGKLWHCSNLYRVAGQETLAERLVDLTFADTAFFTNSGAEAVECAIKMVRKYHHADGHPEKHRVICCTNAFHGRTLATIAAGGQRKMLDGFGPDMDGFDHVRFGNLNELRAAIGQKTAAILVEPIQGEGGINTATTEFLRGLRAAADEFGLLLVFDEVQSGAGRTGKLFAHEWAGIEPDIMAVAKGLGGGFPVGACLATEKAAKGMTPGSHGSTYGGNPLAMAVANAVLDVMTEEGFLANVEAMGARLGQGLDRLVARYPTILIESRGMGLMRGLRCNDHVTNTDFITRARARGLLLVPAGENVARLLPPLIVGAAEIDDALSLLATVCREIEEEQQS